MKARDGITEPVWTRSASVPDYPLPDLNESADVIVVGAGIAGLTTAYLLANAGQSVIVLDEGTVGSGQTGRTSAHLASIIDDRFTEIERWHGLDGSKLAHASHAAAIDKIEQICRDEGIDCNFARVSAYLFSGPDGDQKEVDEELDASKRAGVADVERVNVVPSIQAGAALRFGNQAVFQPMRYLSALAKAAEKKGVKIRTGRRVADVTGARPKDGEPAYVTFQENEQRLSAKHVVVATNTPTPINDWFGIYLKQAAYRTYVVGLSVPQGAIPDALYWDTADPYHYVRLLREPANGRDVLLVGGEDHKTGQGPEGDPFARLTEWAKKVFPSVGAEVSRWSGQVQEPADGLAYIGHALTSGENVYVITGDSGMGLTHGTLGAMLVSDQILGFVNDWEELYKPNRRTMNKDLVSENVNTNVQFTDYLTPGDVSSESEIAFGEGALMRKGLKKIAVYRDDAGTIHKMSAVCPHLKCIVHWNKLEKSWDCPCHGSRFDCEGRMVMGPSVDDLAKEESSE
jgi:glycine/D-amino acid oxidase-like deaminating enzyme/nitrite reductase/ring-hydroxylating ferredoxin subunit